MVCNNLSEWFIICNNFAVEKLAAEPSYTPATAQLMADSFDKRRFWVLKGKNVNIGVLFRRYKIFSTNPIEVSISICEPQLLCCWQNINWNYGTRSEYPWDSATLSTCSHNTVVPIIIIMLTICFWSGVICPWFELGQLPYNNLEFFWHDIHEHD